MPVPSSSEPSASDPCEGEVKSDEVVPLKEGVSRVERETVVEVTDYALFLEASRKAIGKDDYGADPSFWDAQFRRDYEVINERLRMEHKAVQNGEARPTADLSGLEAPELVTERLGSLRLVSLEQFVLESNQGIFREDRFYCDKGRAWLKKTAQTLGQHGYPYVRKVEVEGRLVLEVSRNPMGVI